MNYKNSGLGYGYYGCQFWRKCVLTNCDEFAQINTRMFSNESVYYRSEGHDRIRGEWKHSGFRKNSFEYIFVRASILVSVALLNSPKLQMRLKSAMNLKTTDGNKGKENKNCFERIKLAMVIINSRFSRTKLKILST